MGYLRLYLAHPRTLSYGFITAFFSGLGQTHLVALYSPHIMSTYSLSNAQYGTLYSTITLISGLMITYFGPMIDRYDLRLFAIVTGLGLGLSQLAFLNNGSFMLMTLGILGLRFFGQGLCSSLSSISVARYFDRQRGMALALSQTGYPVFEGFITPLTALLISQWDMFYVALVFALAAILFYTPVSLALISNLADFNKVRDFRDEPSAPKKPEGATTTAPSWTRHQVLREKTLYLLLPQVLLPPCALTGLLFHQAAIAESKGWSLGLMASGLIFFALGRTFNTFATGPLVDKWQATRLFPFYQIPMSLGFITLGLGYAPWVPALSYALFGFTVGSGGPIKSAIWAELYGIRHLGAIKSLFATLMILSTALSPALFGWLIDQKNGVPTLLLGLFFFSGFAALLAHFALRNFSQKWKLE
jgi:MFS family permease